MEEYTMADLNEMLLKEKENSKLLQSKNAELLKINEDLTTKNTKLTDYNNSLFGRLAQQIPEEEKNTEQKEITPEDKEQSIINEVRGIMHPEIKKGKGE